jgi:integrase
MPERAKTTAASVGKEIPQTHLKAILSRLHSPHGLLALGGQGGEKVGPYRFHDLRRSYGTDLRAAARSFDDVAAIMGISAAMAHVYAHEDTEALQREAIQAGTNPAILTLA